MTAASAADLPDARPAGIDVFRFPDYRRFWASGCVIYVARWVDLVTLGWLALELTGSPFMVGLAAFARTAPMMAFGPVAGAIADQVSAGRVLLVTQSGAMATALALAVLFGSGAGGYWSFVALELVLGVLFTLDFPARRTAVFALLGPSRVARAMSFETVSMQLAKLAGPLLAGFCLARLGVAAAFLLLAALYGVALAIFFRIHRRIARPDLPGPVSMGANLRAGLHAAWTNRTIRAVLLGTIAMNVLVWPYQNLLSVFSRDVLSAGPEVLGGLVAAEGLGALVGALVLALRREHLPHGRLFAGAILAAPIMVVAFSQSRWLALCLALLVILGLADAAFGAMQSTLVLLAAPEHVRGGTLGILSVCIGTQPVGTLTLGALAGIAGAPIAFTIFALAALGVSVPVAAPLLRR